MQLEEIWDQINRGSELEVIEDRQGAGLLKDAYQAAVSLAIGHEEPWACWYAASRAAYLLTCADSLQGPADRSGWEAACLATATRSLACRKGYQPAILCILHLWMDQGEIAKAAALALSLEQEAIDRFPYPIVADRLMEARIRCLADLGLWLEAETEMRYFDRRTKDDPNCGIDLINFFKFLKPPVPDESFSPETLAARSRVLALIADLLDGDPAKDPA